MPRRAGGGGVLDGGGGGSGTVGNSPPRREVEVTVYDRLLNEVRAFRCDQHLLETSMAYFEPIIRHYLEEEEQQHENDAQRQEGRRHGLCGDSKKTHASTTTATSTTAAAVTRTTSNNTNNYHNTSTGDVSRGRNEADARRGEEDDLEGSGSCRRSGASSLPPIPLRVNCDLDIFSWLMSYVEGKMRPFTPENAVSIALSSNFLLMTELVDLPLQYIKENLVQVMLSGVNMECLTGELLARLCNMLSDGDITRAFLELYDWRAEYTSNRRFLTALLRHMVSVRLSDKRSTGLRWCQYCGVLFDEYELHRLERNGKNVKPVLCPRLTNNFIGTRGEILSTHVASKHPVNLPFPSLAWSDEHVERWAWRIIGAMHFFLCRQCNHLVPLIDTITHGCSGGVASFTCIEDANRAGSEALLAWFGASKGFYSGGLTPMYSHQTDIPRELVLTLSSTGEWISETGDERPIPGLWCTHPVAVERSVDKKGRVNVDTLNGFERWLVEELQQMMEEFGEGRQRSSFANQTHMDAATRALIPGMSVMTTEASHNNNNNNNNHHHHHSLPPAVILGNRGGGGESSNESLYMRTSYRGNRGDGRSGVNTRNDGLPKRREMSSAANGVGQRMKIASGGANMTHDSNKVTTNFTFASPLRVKSAQPVRPSMQSLAMLGRGSPVSSQMQRKTLWEMNPPPRSPLRRDKTAWIWNIDAARLRAIDFLAYRLGLFQSSPEKLSSGGGGTSHTRSKLKAVRLNSLAAKSSSPLFSSSSFVKKSCMPSVKTHSFSSVDTMQRMLREWEKKNKENEINEIEEENNNYNNYNKEMTHPPSLFDDEAAVLSRFGMGAFASPTAPGFTGLFRQHWRDFYVTEMVTDASGVAAAISREHDFSVPPLPPSLLGEAVTAEREKSVNGSNDNSNININNNNNNSDDVSDVVPSSSFFTVNMEGRLMDILKEDTSEKGPMNSPKPNVVAGTRTTTHNNRNNIASSFSSSGTRQSEGSKKNNNHYGDAVCDNNNNSNDLTTDSMTGKRGFYLQCYLHKQHTAHSVALANIAQTLRMHPSGISVAGIKDYIGDTIQRVRLENITPAAAIQANRFFRMKKWSMTLSDFSYQTEPLIPGRLFGNHFRIILRDVTAPREDVERALHDFQLNGFPNYYGCQRFSWFGGKNDAAFALLHHNWLVFAFRFLGYTNREMTLRELLQREKKYPTPLQDEYRRNVVRRLRRIAIEPTELDVAPFLSCPPLGVPPTSAEGGPISQKQELIILQLRGAFFDLDKRDRRLTAQRLCSYLWNQVLTLRLHHFGLEVLAGDIVLPETFRCVAALPVDRTDFYREGTRFINEDGEGEDDKSKYSIMDVMHPGFSFNGILRPRNAVGEYYLQVCEKYHLDWYAHHTKTGLHDFIEPPRPIIRKPIDLRHEYNEADSKLTIEFALERGSYANVAISELMKLLRCAGSENILLLPAPDSMWSLGGRDPGYVTSMQDIYDGFEDGLGFVRDKYEIPSVGGGRLWDYSGPLFLPAAADSVRLAYRWGRRHLIRNMERRARDEAAMKARLFERPLAETLREGEVDQYAGHTVPMSPNTRAKKVFFKVLRRQRRFPCAPKTVPRVKRGAEVQNRTSVQVPFKTISRNTWNVTW